MIISKNTERISLNIRYSENCHLNISQWTNINAFDEYEEKYGKNN